MRRIKLIRVYNRTFSCHDEHYTHKIRVLGDSASAWQEVDDNTFLFIFSNLWQLNLKEKDSQLFLIEDESEQILEKIQDIKTAIEKSQKEQKERDEKYKKDEIKRKIKAKKTRLEKAKKLLKEEGLLK